MKFTLPMPPGINRTYGASVLNRGALYKKDIAKDWEKEAGWLMKQQLMNLGNRRRLLPLVNNVTMDINWFYRNNRDIDAGIKILLDFLQKHRVYNDDMQIIKVTLSKESDPGNPRVEVEIGDIN